jgi:hypothetical protein
MHPILLSLFLFASLCSLAQAPLRYRTDIPVEMNGTQLPNAWAGGFNAPQFSTIDLNFDGANDLFVFDRTTDRFQTFLQVNLGNGPEWKYAPEYEAGFPRDLSQFVLLADYNHDGRKDIFTRHPSGARVYRNVGQPGSGPGFVIAQDCLTFSSIGYNMQMLGTDISAFTDVDGDQDIDVLTFDWALGSQMNFYKNMSVENFGHPDTLAFELATPLYGNFRECNGCDNYTFNNTSCRVAGPGSPPDSTAGILHIGASSILAADLDANGAIDLVLGDELCENLAVLYNQGTPAQPSFNSLQPVFPSINPAGFYLFPAAYLEDVNFDSRPDLLVAPNQFNNILDSIDFQHSAWLYTDANAAGPTKFQFQKQDFLQEGMIDLGQSVVPAFADLDADGDLDMVIATDGIDTPTGFRGSLYRFENTGNASDPSFSLIDEDYLGVAALQLRDLRISFADANGDQSPDLVLSSWHPATQQSQMRFLPNQSAAGQPYSFGSTFSPINIVQGRGHVPFFYDLDNDQDLDILVGTYGGRVIRYDNTGTAANPFYVQVTTTFAGIGNDAIKRHSFPIVTDLDSDGLPDMVVADDSGKVKLFSDFLNQVSSTQFPRTDIVYSLSKNTQMATRTGRAHITVFSGNSLAAADLDGDGKVELVMGSYGGGLQMLSRTGSSTTAVNAPVSDAWQVSVFPNPISSGILQVNSRVPVKTAFFDLLGRILPITHSGILQTAHTLNVSHLPAGVYLLQLTDARGNATTQRVIISK